MEHFIEAPAETKLLAMECFNEIMQNLKLYNSTTFCMSVSQMLHKGKGKPIEKQNSYRRISIGQTPQKIIDAYFAPDTGKIARIAQPKTQFGFTMKKNYLEASVLRETLQTYSEKKMYA